MRHETSCTYHVDVNNNVLPLLCTPSIIILNCSCSWWIPTIHNYKRGKPARPLAFTASASACEKTNAVSHDLANKGRTFAATYPKLFPWAERRRCWNKCSRNMWSACIPAFTGWLTVNKRASGEFKSRATCVSLLCLCLMSLKGYARNGGAMIIMAAVFLFWGFRLFR